MKVKDIIKKMEQLAPVFLKEDFDNVGLMVGDRDKSVSKVLLALDCTIKVIEEAKREGVDLIITHHPLIFRKPNSITTDTIQGKKIIELIKNDISLYSSHTNLDSVEGGLNSTIVSILGFKNSQILQQNNKEASAGLGRVVKLDEKVTLDELIDKIKTSLNIANLRVVKGNDSISKVAIINGSGQDFIGKAVALGVDTVITGDTTYHFALDYKEMGVNIIDVGHFSSEQVVFFNVMDKLTQEFPNIKFIRSQVEEDPYTFV